MARIGKGKLGASVVVVGMVLSGASYPAYASVAAGQAAAKAKSYSCEVKSSSAEAPPQYDHSKTPPVLTAVKWTGGGSATCTIPMKKISFEIFAGIIGDSTSHTIAAGSCKGCSKVTARDKGYSCEHVITKDKKVNCSGAWESVYRVDFTPPRGKKLKFKPTSKNCFAYGAGAACYLRKIPSVAPIFASSLQSCAETAALSDRRAVVAAGEVVAAGAECVTLPESGFPLLSLAAIKNIRDTHFKDGATADKSKGLFLSGVTDDVLGKVFEKGIQDKDQWKQPDGTVYFEKTFAYPDHVGDKSGGAPATKVTLRVSKSGHGKNKDGKPQYSDIVAMYPADV